MAARSLWNGTISFALVHVPVKVFSATEDRTVHFREVHLADGSPIEHRRFCTKEDEEVDYDDVVKGYEVKEDEFVVLTKDEVKAAAGPRTKSVELEHFVPAEDIEPVVHDRTYVLGPRDEDTAPSYALLHAALKKTGRAGIGRWVFHDRERLVAVRPHGKLLALSVLRFADQLVDPKDVDLPKLQKAPSKKEVDMAGQLVEGMHERFKPDQYEDTYRAAVLGLIEARAKGTEPPAADEGPEDVHDDLLEALQASLPKKKKASSAKKKAKA